MDANMVYQLVCGGFFVMTTVVSLFGTLVGSGACDDCIATAKGMDPLVPAMQLAAALCPPRRSVMDRL